MPDLIHFGPVPGLVPLHDLLFYGPHILVTEIHLEVGEQILGCVFQPVLVILRNNFIVFIFTSLSSCILHILPRHHHHDVLMWALAKGFPLFGLILEQLVPLAQVKLLDIFFMDTCTKSWLLMLEGGVLKE